MLSIKSRFFLNFFLLQDHNSKSLFDKALTIYQMSKFKACPYLMNLQRPIQVSILFLNR